MDLYRLHLCCSNKKSNTYRQEQAILDFVGDLCTCLYNISLCGSFFIFVVVSRAFRQELKKMIYTMCRKNIVVPREEENRQSFVVVSAIVN